ncbi:MAG: methyltransferase domain-containing protein [Rhodospirillales bacterium]|nr:methyltransferase domain-containing protein [Rhodospirillales bacterium]
MDVIHESGFQLEGKAAELYEMQKVPSMFAPLADATINYINILENDIILDAACGTGILARKLRRKLGSDYKIVGADLNKNMIQVAQSLNNNVADSCEWHVADIYDLPFNSETFSLVFCQQGIQYFPDKNRALLEVYRVLKKGGRIVLTVWCKNSIFMRSVSRRLSDSISEEVGSKALAPFSYNGELLEPILSKIGFCDFSVKRLTVNRIISSTKDSIADELMSLPIAESIRDKGKKILRSLVDGILEDMEGYVSGKNIVTPQDTLLIQARVRNKV